MLGLLGDKLGSYCGGSFMPSPGLKLFLWNAEPLEALSRRVMWRTLGFETALASDGELNALGMSHEWDVVTWGCKREQYLEYMSAWVTIA